MSRPVVILGSFPQTVPEQQLGRLWASIKQEMLHETC